MNVLHRSLIAFLCIGCGCYDAPKNVGQVRPGPTTNVAELTKRYWDHANPKLLPARGRVAIEEFSVEYVSITGGLPFERQPLFLPPPIDPIGLAITGSLLVSGVGRQSETYEEASMQRITGELYEAFKNNLEQRHLSVAAPAEVTGTRAYASLKTEKQAASSPLRFLQRSFSTDAGRVESSITVPAPGLAVVTSGWGRDNADRTLCQQVNAEASLAVHLRIVIYRGNVGLMQGSTIRVVPKNGDITTLSSKRTIVSDNMVVQGDKWSPGAGSKMMVDATKLSQETSQLWPVYLDFAFGRRPATQPVLQYQ